MRQVPLIIEPDPDDPDSANVLVDVTIAGRPYRLLLDTGAALTQLILGYPTIRLANWLFDFPARRWTITN